MRQIVFRHQARSELDKAGDWYERERTGLGLEFFAEIDHLLQRAANNPEQYPRFVSRHAKSRRTAIPLLRLFPRTESPHRRRGCIS